MRGTDIAGKMKTIAQNYKTSYIWGGIGQPITDTSITQAVNQYKDNLAYASRARKLIGKKPLPSTASAPSKQSSGAGAATAAKASEGPSTAQTACRTFQPIK